MKLAIITISVREERVGPIVGHWVSQFATEQAQFDQIETIDLKDLDLPVFNEPHHPRLQNYQFDYTKRLSQLIQSADAYIFVTPEYNYFAPSAIVNLIDYLSLEWNYKAAGLVSYGGVSGGLRSAQAVKPLMTTVKMMPIPEGTSFHFVDQYIKDGQLHPEEHHLNSTTALLNELSKWTKALAPLRNNS